MLLICVSSQTLFDEGLIVSVAVTGPKQPNIYLYVLQKNASILTSLLDCLASKAEALDAWHSRAAAHVPLP